MTTPLTLDVDTHTIYARQSGEIVGAAWGPAADDSGQWFVRWGDADAERVANKDAAAAWLEKLGGAA